MIGIVGYGLGNVRAISNIYKRLGVPAEIVRTSEDLQRADKAILPGVGAFDSAMSMLEASGLRPALNDFVLAGARPVLGICVGMQMLAEGSDEGRLPGLSWLGGRIRRFDLSGVRSKPHLPHMGWNEVVPRARSPLFDGLERPVPFYFLHSYFFDPSGDSSPISETDYHGVFASAVNKGKIFGVQFHPEKSHEAGVRLLRNFAELC